MDYVLQVLLWIYYCPLKSDTTLIFISWWRTSNNNAHDMILKWTRGHRGTRQCTLFVYSYAYTTHVERKHAPKTKRFISTLVLFVFRIMWWHDDASVAYIEYLSLLYQKNRNFMREMFELSWCLHKFKVYNCLYSLYCSGAYMNNIYAVQRQ